MKEATPTLPSPPSPFAGSDWFDPLEEAVRGQVRGFIEQLLEEELEAALGRGRYERGAISNGRRHGHRPRQLVTTFGPVTLSVRGCTTRPASRSGRARFCRPTSGSAAAPRR
jgi:Transposase, Mutator family